MNKKETPIDQRAKMINWLLAFLIFLGLIFILPYLSRFLGARLPVTGLSEPLDLILGEALPLILIPLTIVAFLFSLAYFALFLGSRKIGR